MLSNAFHSDSTDPCKDAPSNEEKHMLAAAGAAPSAQTLLGPAVLVVTRRLPKMLVSAGSLLFSQSARPHALVLSLPVLSLALAVVALAVVELAVVALAVVELAVVALAVVALAVVALAVVELAVVELAVVARVQLSSCVKSSRTSYGSNKKGSAMLAIAASAARTPGCVRWLK